MCVTAVNKTATPCMYHVKNMSIMCIVQKLGANLPLLVLCVCLTGNAVMYGDSVAWHVDADPASFPSYSPWVHNYGYYINRWA